MQCSAVKFSALLAALHPYPYSMTLNDTFSANLPSLKACVVINEQPLLIFLNLPLVLILGLEGVDAGDQCTH